MLQLEKDNNYIIPEITIVEDSLKTAKLSEFRAIWNIYSHHLIIAPKSSSVIFGYDLGVFTKGCPVDDVYSKLLESGFEIEKSYLMLGDGESLSDFYTKVKCGQLPISFVDKKDSYYEPLKKIVDRRVSLYSKKSKDDLLC